MAGVGLSLGCEDPAPRGALSTSDAILAEPVHCAWSLRRRFVWSIDALEESLCRSFPVIRCVSLSNCERLSLARLWGIDEHS
jgi:hypothetical protein